MKNNFVFDVEADGPCPGLYSMVSIGIVAVWDHQITFRGELSPISDRWIDEALAVSGVSREEQLNYPAPEQVICDLDDWFSEISAGRPVMWSDNPAFDWQFLNYYFHRFLGKNPCGFSARRIGDFFAGLNKTPKDANSWKRLRQTRHTHDPLDDALGNAEALVKLWRDAEVKDL